MAGSFAIGSLYSRFFKEHNLISAIKLIRLIPKQEFDPTGYTSNGSKPFGSVVIGRNNLVSAAQRGFEDIPTDAYSEDLGAFKLEGFVNNAIFNIKENSLKVIDPIDHQLSCMIDIPINGITRSKPKPKTRTAKQELELDSAKRKVNASFLGDSAIRANQHFITNTLTMDDYTLEVLIIELENWSQSEFNLKNTKDGIHPVIAVTVLATSLFYGMPIEDIINKVQKLALKKDSDGYFISEKENSTSGHWLFQTPLAELVMNNHTFDDTEPVENTYRLPIPNWLTQKIIQTKSIKQKYVDLGLIEKKLEKVIKQLGFVWTVSNFKKEYELFFVNIRKKYPGIELNLNLVEHYLQNASLHDYDVIFSAYFTNKRTLFSHTQLFYTRIQEKRIYSKFAEFWDARFFNIGQTHPELSHLHNWPSLNDERYVGSALVPKKTVVKKIVTELQRSLKQTQKTLSINEILQYHLNYSIYTMIFLSYATGYRGVHTLLPSWRLISDDNKWLAISDKDDQDATHTRLTYLSPIISEHLKHYQRHLNAFLNKVLLISFEIHQKLIDTLRDWKFKLDYRSSAERFVLDDSLQGAFFNIDIDKPSIKQISLNYFFDYLKKEKHIELPANGGRHLIRTEALNEGIPSDLIDAFLGHFIYGNEPHSAYSALANPEIETGMQSFLQNHLKSMGFKPLKSRLTQ